MQYDATFKDVLKAERSDGVFAASSQPSRPCTVPLPDCVLDDLDTYNMYRSMRDYFVQFGFMNNACHDEFAAKVVFPNIVVIAPSGSGDQRQYADDVTTDPS